MLKGKPIEKSLKEYDRAFIGWIVVHFSLIRYHGGLV